MIVKEFYGTRKDGVNLYRTFSDANKTILQNETGIEYSEAVDIEDSPYSYTETDKEIEHEPTSETNTLSVGDIVTTEFVTATIE